ncbi:8562_t:CDS:1, partial [Dentiscutata erythropus]
RKDEYVIDNKVKIYNDETCYLHRIRAESNELVIGDDNETYYRFCYFYIIRVKKDKYIIDNTSNKKYNVIYCYHYTNLILYVEKDKHMMDNNVKHIIKDLKNWS